MSLTEHDIDWIVGEVVRRIRALHTTSTTPLTQPSALTQLALNDRLITLEKLRGKLTNIRQLVVSTSAIVTPAVKDELKRHNVQLVRGTANASTTAHSTTPSPTTGLLAANLGSDYRRETLAQLTKSYGATLQDYPSADAAKLIATQGEQVVRQSQRAVWFTSQPAQVACLANRQSGVWAIVGHDLESLNSALPSVTANVLIIDPRKKSQYQLRQMLAAFVK